MIIDSMKNIGVYKPILKGLDAGLAAVKALGEHPEVGKYTFDGGYFMVQEGNTKSLDEGDFEPDTVADGLFIDLAEGAPHAGVAGGDNHDARGNDDKRQYGNDDADDFFAFSCVFHCKFISFPLKKTFTAFSQ